MYVYNIYLFIYKIEIIFKTIHNLDKTELFAIVINLSKQRVYICDLCFFVCGNRFCFVIFQQRISNSMSRKCHSSLVISMT